MNNLTANNQQGYNTIIVSLLSNQGEEVVETPKRKTRELYKTLVQIKDAKIEEIKQRRRLHILPDGNIPNSRVARMIDKLDAEATLEYAKSLNRPVRMAKEGECQSYYENHKNKHEKQIDFLGEYDACKYLGIPVPKWRSLKQKYGIVPAKITNQRFFFSIDQLDEFQANYGPFYFE